MSECAKYDVLISMAVDGELDKDEKSELDAHLAVCSECRAYLKLLQSIRKDAGETLAQPPEKLAEGIMYKVRLEASRKHARFFIFGRYTAIAAVFCLVLFTAYKLIPLFSQTGMKSENAASSAVSAEAGLDAYGAAEADAGTKAFDAQAAGKAGGSALKQNTALSGADEAKTDEGGATRMMTAVAPDEAPQPTAESAGLQSAPEYDVGNTRGYEIYRNLKYDESFYSVCIIYGEAPDRIKDCEILYSGEGQTHYKVPLETMLDLELSKDFDEIYYDDLNADYGLVIALD